MKIVMTGPPGSGKGTQGKKISKNLNIPHISIGGLLRKLANKDSILGREINEIIDTGKLVPTNVVINEVTERIKEKDCINGFILDGVRRLEEAVPLQEKILFNKFIHINISEEESHKRLGSRQNCSLCGEVYGTAKLPKEEGKCDSCESSLYQRDDDTYEIIQQRLDVFKKQGQPILNFADSLNILSIINGEQSLENVFQEIIKKLD